MKRIVIFIFLLLAGLDFNELSAQGTKYKLVWEENFDQKSLDTSVWNIEIVSNPANKEMQYYVEEAVELGEDPKSGESSLIITVQKKKYKHRHFTSGRLNSIGKLSFRYGRVDARIKMPKTGNGLWPAFWMKGADNDSIPWPMCGELDIIELGHVDGIKRGISDRYLGAACHWGPKLSINYSESQKKTIQYSIQDDEYHIYTLIWDETCIKIYVDLDKYPDAEPYYRFCYADNCQKAATFYRKPYSFILNLAVGGGYTGITGNDNVDKITALNEENNLEAKMYIDYIRIYQTGNSHEELHIPPTK